MTWRDARLYCKDKGDNLASIHSKWENDFISRYLCDTDACWIGLTDEKREGHFKWVDGSRVSYTNWRRGEPNNDKGNEDVVIIYPTGWNDVPSYSYVKFLPVCKRRKTARPTNPPTGIPTKTPTNSPTGVPTWSPTNPPTGTPTWFPTTQPTVSPTAIPTGSPTTLPTNFPTGTPTWSPTTQPTVSPTTIPTASPTTQPTVSPTALPTGSPTTWPTNLPTGIPTPPTLSPTGFCGEVLCYGYGAFGANCNGPSDDVNFPIILSKSTTSYQDKSKIPMGHVEIFPSFSVDLTSSIKVRFDTKITNISDGYNHGAVFTLSVKNDGCYSQLFTLTQPMWAATTCADDHWHSWEVFIYYDGIVVSCDENVVWNHARADLQVSWEIEDEFPFLSLGAYYSPIHNTWLSRCDMVIWNVVISTCDTSAPSSTPSKSPTALPTLTPSKSPTALPTLTPTHFPTDRPTKLPTTLPTSHPTKYPTQVPTYLPSKLPSKSPTGVPTSSPTGSCSVLAARCYGTGAFGAECKGPSNDLDFPIILTKSTTQDQSEEEGVCRSHIEVYPTKSIDLTESATVCFDAMIFDIAGGNHYGSVYTLSVKHDGSNREVFTFNHQRLASTACNDGKWHSWKTMVYSDTVRVYCDEALVHTHERVDSQKNWNARDGSPFLVLGAHYSFENSKYISRCDMIIQNLRIFTCETQVDV